MTPKNSGLAETLRPAVDLGRKATKQTNKINNVWYC